MKITVSVDSNIDIPKHMKAIRDPAFWTYAASEWHRLYKPYVPRDEGFLMNTVTIRPKEIEHSVPYAHYQYEGHFNFRKDKNPKASRHWDKAAKPTEEDKLIRSLQGYIDKGKVKL